MRIHYLSCGTFCPFSERLTNGEGSLLGIGRMVCHCLLIETSGRLILVDTGLGTADVAIPSERLPSKLYRGPLRIQLRYEDTAIHQVRSLGFDPRDVRDIVLTHLDFDHAGGLSDFPWARVHVYGVEYDTAMEPRKRMDWVRYRPEQWVHDPHWVVHRLVGDTWRGLEAVQVLHPNDAEILLVPLRGHTRGHCGVAIRTPSGWLLHAGDAIFSGQELGAEGGHCPLGLRLFENVFQYNRGWRLQSVERLRALANDPEQPVQVLCSHDPAMLEQARVQVESGAYLG